MFKKLYQKKTKGQRICKAAVVCAGLAANGGKGGARPRRGGDKGGPESPTNRPAYGGRAPRPG